MSNRPDDDLDIPSIVPERDELASRSGRRVKTGGGGKRAEGSTAPRAASGSLSGSVRLLLSVLTIAMLAGAVAAWYFYSEGQAILGELEHASGRIQALENRLSAVGDDTEETTLNLIERIDLNFTEIDKLWAARNENRNNIATQRATLEEHSEIIGSVESALEAQNNMLNSADAQLANLQSRVNTITENIASMEDIDRQITALQAQMNQAESSIDNLESIGNRVLTTEQDIESINVYRLQLNQTISTLRDQIRNLQQRVGASQP